jgi:U1 small nuclear ribonucleoprotein 70kDa
MPTRTPQAKHEAELAAKTEAYRPLEDPNATGDAFKTLFIGRLSYDVTEPRLVVCGARTSARLCECVPVADPRGVGAGRQREFEAHGPVKKVRLVSNAQTGEPRGYAFVEYEREKDMKGKEGAGPNVVALVLDWMH